MVIVAVAHPGDRIFGVGHQYAQVQALFPGRIPEHVPQVKLPDVDLKKSLEVGADEPEPRVLPLPGALDFLVNVLREAIEPVDPGAVDVRDTEALCLAQDRDLAPQHGRRLGDARAHRLVHGLTEFLTVQLIRAPPDENGYRAGGSYPGPDCDQRFMPGAAAEFADDDEDQ